MEAQNVVIDKQFEFTHQKFPRGPELAKIVYPDSENKDWGKVTTSDNIRYNWLDGLQLVTQSGGTITNEMIDELIIKYTLELEQKLKYQFYPTVYRHRDPDPRITREKQPHEKWDDLYTFKPRSNQKKWYVRLRHRPLIRVEKWEYLNRVNSPIRDLMEGAKINHSVGILENTFWLAFGDRPFMGPLPMRSGAALAGHPSYKRMPGAYAIDYVAGLEHSSDIPEDIRSLIESYVVVHLLNAFGDAQVAGLASFSISLGSVHESVSTTQSATSATYGARIKEHRVEHINKFWKEEAQRYALPEMFAVG
jgi:hypothetical protein